MKILKITLWSILLIQGLAMANTDPELYVDSEPPGIHIDVDGQYAGKTPTSIKMPNTTVIIIKGYASHYYDQQKMIFPGQKSARVFFLMEERWEP